MHLGSFPDAVKKMVVDRWEPRANVDDLVILNFTLAVCGHPDQARPTIKLVSDLIIRMLGRFREWAREEGLAPESRGSLAPEVWAKKAKATALYKLSQSRKTDLETRWLFSLLRAIGDIPETWSLRDVFRHWEASRTSSPHYAPVMQGITPAPQHVMSTASRIQGQPPSYHSTPAAGAPRAWGQGSPGLPTGHPASAPGTSPYQQPTHPAIRATTALPSSTNVGEGPVSSASITVAPAPHDVLNVYRGGSAPHPTTGPTPSSGTPHESARPVQAMAPPSFEAILQYEYLRLLQMQNLEDRAKYLVELFYRSLYTETGSFFTNSPLSPIYALAIKDVPEHTDKFVVYMHKRFQYELALVSKVM